MPEVQRNTAPANGGLSRTTVLILTAIAAVIAFLLRGGVSTEGFSLGSILEFGIPHDTTIVTLVDTLVIDSTRTEVQTLTRYVRVADDEKELDTLVLQDPAARARLDSLRFVHERTLREMEVLRTHVRMEGSAIARRTIRVQADADSALYTYNDTLGVIADVTTNTVTITSNPEIIVRAEQLIVDCGQPWWVYPAVAVAAVLVREALPLLIK